MYCSICKNPMQNVLTTDHSVCVNNYSLKPETQYVEQEAFYCNECQYIKNQHPWTMEQLFGAYAYTSPSTKLLSPILDRLEEFCREHDINSICEVGGNNGLFLSELQKRWPNATYHNIDKWHDSILHPNIETVCTFVDDTSKAHLKSLKPQLVICRHMLAHNPDATKLVNNIISQLHEPKFLYIENSDFERTIALDDYGQLYPEHFYAFSKNAIAGLLKSSNYSLTKAFDFEIHNGSFGCLFTAGIGEGIELDTIAAETKLDQRIANWKKSCLDFEKRIEKEERPIAVVGISAKFVFTCNAILTDAMRLKVDQIYDSTKKKEGMYPPGFNTKVQSERQLSEFSKHGLLVVGARNFFPEIKAKLIAQGFNSENIITPPF